MAVGYVQFTSEWHKSRYVCESNGPDTLMEDPDPKFKRNPVGFVWDKPVENEPLLWNGDNA